MELNNINYDYIESILQCLPSNIFYKDTECRYLFCTHIWHHVETNDDPNWTIKGKTDFEIRKDKKNAMKAYEEDKKIIKTGIGSRYIIEYNDNNVKEYLEIIKEPHIVDGKVVGIVGLINDVTKQIMAEQQLEILSETDELTRLNNRTFLSKWMNTINNESFYPLGLVSVDLNDLKQINDSYGHIVGDEYIRTSSSILKMVFPKESWLIRMGGDEFLAIIPNMSQMGLIDYVSKLKNTCNNYIIHDKKVSLSVGTFVLDKFKKDITDEINISDMNMYLDKKEYHREQDIKILAKKR